MIDPLDLDQVGAVRAIAEEIQQAFHRDLKHLAPHQTAFVPDEQRLSFGDFGEQALEDQRHRIADAVGDTLQRIGDDGGFVAHGISGGPGTFGSISDPGAVAKARCSFDRR